MQNNSITVDAVKGALISYCYFHLMIVNALKIFAKYKYSVSMYPYYMPIINSFCFNQD